VATRALENGVDLEEVREGFDGLLREAEAFRRAMAAPLPDTPLKVIAGDCVLTARYAVRLDRGGGGWGFYPGEVGEEPDRLRRIFDLGDGTVPRSSSAPDGRASFFCDGHQGLAMDPNVHREILRFLGE
jgi:hypothetical protein